MSKADKTKVIVRCVGPSATNVTGSSYLVECPTGEKILLDHGMFQSCSCIETYRVNKKTYDFKPKEITAVIVSHAHLDHQGLIPRLYKEGFRGTTYISNESIRFCKPMFEDSVKIFERETASYERKYKKQCSLVYDLNDVELALEHFEGVENYEPIYISENVWFKYINSYHIWGSRQILLYVKKPNGQTIKIAFTGDLGNTIFEQPFVRKLDEIDKCNLLIGEATYNTPEKSCKKYQRNVDIEILKSTIQETCVEKKGNLLIPAFALQRVETILYYLWMTYKDDENFKIPVILDSPLGLKLLEDGYMNMLSLEWLDILKEMLSWKNLKIIRDYEESFACVQDDTPKIIIASSGMASQGRCLLHLQKILPNPNNTILTCGYMADGTIGAKIVSGQKTITIDSKTYPNRCKLETLKSFSGHMQYEQLLDYYTKISENGCMAIWIVHSNSKKEEFANALRNRIRDIFKTTKVISTKEDTSIEL